MKETKLAAIYKLFNKYTDEYGRVTLYKAELSDPRNGKYDSENQGLWTGEAGLLLALNGYNSRLHNEYKPNFNKMLDNINVGTPGLYSRHPAPFYEKPHHNVSKDEYRGIAYGCSVTGNREVMEEIVAYGEDNRWFFVDDDPYGGINLDHLGAFRLPGDRALSRIIARKNPGIIGLLFLGVSAILNSRKPAEDTSSKIMSYFSFQAIEMVGFKSKILRVCRFLFDRNMKKCYNTNNYMEECLRIYFKDPSHPFHELIKGL